MKIGNLAVLGAVAIALGAASQRMRAPEAVKAGASGAVAALKSATPASAKPRSNNFFMRLYRDMNEDRLFAVAAGVGFYALLALIPSIAAAVSVFGLFANPERLSMLPDALTTVLPQEAVKLVQTEAHRLAEQSTGSLSIKLAIALALSLWGASASVRATFDALNVIDDQEEQRSIVRLYGTAILVTLGGIVAFIVTIAMIGADPKFVALGPFSAGTVELYSLLRWPVFLVFAVFALTLVYWIGPSKPPAHFFRLLPGAIFAALVTGFGSWGFGFYVSHLANYTATYGSLATVVVLMTWMWLSAAIMLLGAQINYELANKGGRPPDKNTIES